ncbi:helix-turn-helix transcriptional regulator [Brevibacterium jeotgali]|uniref:Regulatory protein, luxR family n=1 Tax=Brevibacterium jeotgali TaxID=1262550 RepID=A0A2H1L399_9MICO|nr:LuxR C-terminal-related transcriptional regulator [Brevibacterium jeotgali]TWC01632.1 AAA ATPase-like protein [Brevibacterium jeotgali]SMY11377.1 regulatory protein, luxR family [Brevibacterium jeotgali]
MGFEVRQRELVRLRAKIDQRLNVAVVGGQGMGKTALVDALLHDIDATIVRVPCSRSDSTIRLSGVRVALAALRILGDNGLVSDLMVLAESDLTAAERADAAVDRILEASLPGSVLVVIDGIDYLDHESQEIIGHILRRMSSSPMRAVVTARRLAEDGPLSGIPVIELEPLDRMTTIELAHEMVQETISDDAATTAAVASGGNPVVLQNILTSMTARQRRGEAPFPRPVRTSDATARASLAAIGDVSEDALEMLRIIALAPLTPAVPLQRCFAHVWEEIDELISRGTVEQESSYLRVGDPLLRSALHWGMTAGQRSALRKALVAEVLVASESAVAEAPVGEATVGERIPTSEAVPATASASGLARTRTAGSLDDAITRWHLSFTEFSEEAPASLLRDARSLVIAGLEDAGVSFAERALMLAPNPAVIARRLLSLAEELALNGDLVFAERYARFAKTNEDTELQMRALALTIQADFFRREAVPAGVLHLWGAREIDEAPDAVARVQLMLALCHAERFELAEAEELIAAADELSASFSAMTRMMHGCARVMLDGYRGHGEQALAVYRTLLAPRRALMPAFTAITAARALTYSEHFTEAREIFELIERRLSTRSLWYPIVPILRAELEIRVGNLHHLPDLFSQANRRRIPGQSTREDQRLLLECWNLYARGRESDAEEVEQALVRRASATGNRGALALHSALQGSHLLAVGLPAEAVRHLQRCDELAPGDIDPAVIRHEPDLIEALIRVGRREHAVLVLQRFRSRLTRFPSRWGELSAQRCEALLASGTESLEIFRRVLRGWRPVDSDQEKARTLAAYAQRLRDLGAKSDAADPLLAALTLYERTGDRVRARSLTPVEVREVAVRPENTLLTQLSEEERRVVDLVREGCRNREIAEKIFVSLRTVEIRLTGIYRRFGVRSRTELVAKLTGVEETVPG